MSPSDQNDRLWNAAWEWVIREHEQQLDAAARAELVAWLASDPAHLKKYEEAHRVWLAAALAPVDDDPVHDDPVHDDNGSSTPKT